VHALRGGDGDAVPLLVKAPHAHLDLKSPITYITDCKVHCARACALCLYHVCVGVCGCVLAMRVSRVSICIHIPAYPRTQLRSVPFWKETSYMLKETCLCIYRMKTARGV
jgi:hypothetical protein